jgi:hypothetical protein
MKKIYHATTEKAFWQIVKDDEIRPSRPQTGDPEGVYVYDDREYALEGLFGWMADMPKFEGQTTAALLTIDATGLDLERDPNVSEHYFFTRKAVPYHRVTEVEMINIEDEEVNEIFSARAPAGQEGVEEVSESGAPSPVSASERRAWKKNDDAVYDEHAWYPIDNVWIPNEKRNAVYDDVVSRYDRSKKKPAVTGRSAGVGSMTRDDGHYWKKLTSGTPDARYEALLVDDGVHRSTSAARTGGRWVLATLNAVPGASLSGGVEFVDGEEITEGTSVETRGAREVAEELIEATEVAEHPSRDNHAAFVLAASRWFGRRARIMGFGERDEISYVVVVVDGIAFDGEGEQDVEDLARELGSSRWVGPKAVEELDGDVMEDAAFYAKMFKSHARAITLKDALPNPIPVWRVLFLKDVGDYEPDLGDHWSFDKRAALKYGREDTNASGGKATHIVSGLAPHDKVDWTMTVDRNTKWWWEKEIFVSAKDVLEKEIRPIGARRDEKIVSKGDPSLTEGRGRREVLAEMARSAKFRSTARLVPSASPPSPAVDRLYRRDHGHDPVRLSDVARWNEDPSSRPELSEKYSLALSRSGATRVDKSGKEKPVGHLEDVTVLDLSEDGGLVAVRYEASREDWSDYDESDLPEKVLSAGTELYHGTREDALPGIRSSGLRGDMSDGWSGQFLGPGVYVTTSKREAEEYWSDGTVATVRPKRDLRLLDVGSLGALSKLVLQLSGRGKERGQKLVARVASLGYDGIFSRGAGRGGGGQQAVVFDGDLLSVELSETLLVEDVLPAVERAAEILGDRRAALAAARHDPYPDKRMTPTVAAWIKRKKVQSAEEHAHDIVRHKDLRKRLKGLRVPATNRARTAEVKRLLAYDPTAARAPHEIAAWNAEVARLVDPDADLSPGDLPVVGRHGGFTMYRLDSPEACEAPLVKNAMSWCVTKGAFGKYGGPPYFAVVRDSDKSPFAMVIPAHFEKDPDEAVRNGTNSGRLSALDLRKIRPLVRLALPEGKFRRKKTYLRAVHADAPQVPKKAPASAAAALRTIRDRALAPGEWPAGEAVPSLRDADASLAYARDVIGARWPEGEEVVAKEAWVSLAYARDVIEGKFPEGEAAIAKNARTALDYARDVIKGRFPAGEEVVSKDAWASLWYARDVIKGRWTKGEATIATNTLVSLNYARDVIKGRWPEGEAAIAKDAWISLEYAKDVIKGRFSAGEEIIAKDALITHAYATDVIKGRFEKAEATIAKDAMAAVRYARYVIRGRFEKAEATIAKDAEAARTYARYVIKGRFENGKFIFDEGVNEVTVVDLRKKTNDDEDKGYDVCQALWDWVDGFTSQVRADVHGFDYVSFFTKRAGELGPGRGGRLYRFVKLDKAKMRSVLLGRPVKVEEGKTTSWSRDLEALKGHLRQAYTSGKVSYRGIIFRADVGDAEVLVDVMASAKKLGCPAGRGRRNPAEVDEVIVRGSGSRLVSSKDVAAVVTIEKKFGEEAVVSYEDARLEP